MSQDSNQSKMAEKLEAQGLSNPESKFKWDDGSDHDDVTKIHVRGDAEGIQFIKFDYFGTGQLIDASLHGFSNQGFTQMFEIDHSNGEHLLSVEAYHDRKVIQGLQFKTNWKFSEIMGYDKAYSKFTLAVDGKKIIGFHGSAKANLNSLGAYVTSITPTKLEAKGGKGGKEWNDGPDYEAVTKIHVRAGVKGIHNIKFDYVDKDGHPKEGPTHGSTSAGGFTLEPFEINHEDKEYLLFIDGYYNETSGVIQALQFKTNMKTSELMGCYDDETDTKFSLGSNSNKIIGFHGYAEKYLNSLGAYSTSLPLTRGDLCHNGNTGYVWDDGTFQGVRKVYVYYDSDYMRCVRFDYDNNGKVETREHGSKAAYPVQESEFVLDYPNEFLTSVEGTSVYRYPQSIITSLIFKTSKGRASPIFGNAFSDDQLVKFVLERKGCAFVGFHGRSLYGLLNALGAYFFPLPPPHDGEKLEE
uniref:Jacalin-related lectin 13 n=1 Tax=Noccaea caerulescens TaxID=107243 RepID=A0A1J3IWI4_NOCCA